MFRCPSISCRPNKTILLENYPMGSEPRKLVTSDDDDDDDDDHCPSCDGQYPLLESLKPECFGANKVGRKKKKKRQLHRLAREDVKMSMFNPIKDTTERSLTLEDWLLSTPGVTLDSFRDGELFVLRNNRSSSAKNHKPVDDHDHELDFSLERLVILDRARDLEEENSYSCGASSSSAFCVSSSMKRGRSENREIIKTVRFRSPQGLAHVFVFSSPAAEE